MSRRTIFHKISTAESGSVHVEAAVVFSFLVFVLINLVNLGQALDTYYGVVGAVNEIAYQAGSVQVGASNTLVSDQVAKVLSRGNLVMTNQTKGLGGVGLNQYNVGIQYLPTGTFATGPSTFLTSEAALISADPIHNSVMGSILGLNFKMITPLLSSPLLSGVTFLAPAAGFDNCRVVGSGCDAPGCTTNCCANTPNTSAAAGGCM